MSSNPAITVGVIAEDHASAVLDGVDSKVKQLADQVESSGDKTISKFSQMKTNIKAHAAEIATGIASTTAGMISFATSFSVLERSQLTADKAQLSYQRSLKTLNDLQASGKATSEQLAIATEAVRLNAEKADLAQQHQSDTYMNFMANIPMQMISMGTGISAMFTAITGESLAASLGLDEFKIASISAFITNPVGLAIIGITTLILLLVFNVGGLRDMVFKLGDAILDFLDAHFKPLADAIRWFLDNVAKPLGQFFGGGAAGALPETITTANTSLTSYDTKIAGTGKLTGDVTAGMLANYNSLGAGIDTTSEKLKRYNEILAGTPNTGGGGLGSMGGPMGGQGGGGFVDISFGGHTIHAKDPYASTGKYPVTAHAMGGIINEPIFGFGKSGRAYSFGENGPETITPGVGGSRTLEINLVIDGRKFAKATINDIHEMLRDRHIRTSNVLGQKIYNAG